jgi:hypothetical protein
MTSLATLSITSTYVLRTFLRSIRWLQHRRREKKKKNEWIHELESSTSDELHGSIFVWIIATCSYVIIALYKISQTQRIFRARSENEWCTEVKRMQRQQRSICRGIPCFEATRLGPSRVTAGKKLHLPQLKISLPLFDPYSSTEMLLLRSSLYTLQHGWIKF